MSTQTYSQSQESLVPTYAPFSSHPPRLASLVGGESVAATGWGDLLEGISEGSSQTSTGGGGQVGKSGVSGMTMDERGEGSDRRLESLAQSVESRSVWGQLHIICDR